MRRSGGSAAFAGRPPQIAEKGPKVVEKYTPNTLCGNQDASPCTQIAKICIWGCRREAAAVPNANFSYLCARRGVLVSAQRYLWVFFDYLWALFGYLRGPTRKGGAPPVPLHLFPDLFFGLSSPAGPGPIFRLLVGYFPISVISQAVVCSGHHNSCSTEDLRNVVAGHTNVAQAEPRHPK